MLEKTFCHVKGITLELEKNLWAKGIHHWDEFLAKEHELIEFPSLKLDAIKAELPASKQALQQNNLRYFQSKLPPKEHWRLAHLGKVGFVDIETTGLSRTNNQITILGIYDGVKSHLYVNGKNLPEAALKMKEFDIIVTFNGKQFDIPFIQHHFNCTYDFVHLDLRYMLKELGLYGGLKSIEAQLGISRDASVVGVDGFEAVRLWHRYQRGCEASLQKLLKYNEEDVVNLQTLLNYYLQTKKKMH